MGAVNGKLLIPSSLDGYLTWPQTSSFKKTFGCVVSYDEQQHHLGVFRSSLDLSTTAYTTGVLESHATHSHTLF